MLAIVVHKSNVFMDLSGWSPKYFPEALKREVNGRLQDRALFGSDHPFIPLERWLADFEKEGYKPEVVEKVLYKNAQTILGLTV
jgi:predicted TIM-barrel fold metal-dependent hydrolase